MKKAQKKLVKKVKARQVTETFVSLVLDESGSMLHTKQATISGFNEYVGGLRTSKDKIYFSLTKFNSDGVVVVYSAANMSEVKDLDSKSYKPNSFTPLYDAVGKTILDIQKQLATKGGSKKKVLMVVMTDGEENASREFNQTKISTLIKDKEKEGWTFVYLGANQDSWISGGAMGIARGNITDYKVGNTQLTMASIGKATQAFCASVGGQSTSFIRDFIGEDKAKKLNE